MALRLIARHCLLQSQPQRQLPTRIMAKLLENQIRNYFNCDKIGNREVVGYGWNGSACYMDRLDYPMPPVRFQEANNEICAIREKERCDWKKLSIEEKKMLYRYSFCQTFAEMKAPTGEWKFYLGMGLWASTVAIAFNMIMNLFLMPPMPDTFEMDRKKAQLKRMIDLEMNPVTGLMSQWDYENKKWK